jgi:cytochrome P450
VTHAPEIPQYMRRDVLNPTPRLGGIRESTSVQEIVTVFGTPAYLLTRYETVKAALGDHHRFSTRKPPGWSSPGPPMITAEEQEELTQGSMFAMDPPEHQRLRRMLIAGFTVRRMKRLEARIVEIVDEHLDQMEQVGAPADLVASFALPIPSLVICELIGVPYEDRHDFQRRATHQINFGLPATERLEVERASREYMMSLVKQARRDPGEDLLGMLVREHGAEITDSELFVVSALMLLAGHETTSNMLGLGTVALLQHPEQLAAVRNNPDAIGPAIEELLRYLSVVQNAIPRITSTEVEIDGVVIPAGQIVILSLPAANRDPHFIDCPDTFDITRGAPGHLAFGHGVHRCLGAPLARMEMRIAFPALLRRFPSLTLTVPPDKIQFRTLSLIYGALELPVTW